MTHDEMLKQMNLSDGDLKELLTKFTEFHSSLNPQQQEVIKRSLPTAVSAAQTFGPNVAPEHVQGLLDDKGGMGVAMMAAAGNTESK